MSKIVGCLKLFGLLIGILLVTVLLFAHSRLGFGEPFPEQQQFVNANPLIPENKLEVVADLPIPPGNIAVSKEGRVFFNFHPEYGADENGIKIAELTSTTTYRAFPNQDFQKEILSCLSMRIDIYENVWLLDFAQHALTARPPRLYGFSSTTGAVVANFSFSADIAGIGSMLNDFQIDPSGEFIYIVDTGVVSLAPAIIVYSVLQNRAVRVLSSDQSMFGSSVKFNITGTKVSFGPFGMKIHADTLALDRSGSTLYYGAVTSPLLHSISTSHLLFYYNKYYEDKSVKEALDFAMPPLVKVVSTMKPATDGASTDNCGNIWLTAIEHGALAVAVPVPEKKIERGASFGEMSSNTRFEIKKAIQSTEKLRWPDGLSFGPDGLYITTSALHFKFTNADISRHGPFHIFRIPTEALRAVPELSTCRNILPPAGQ